MILPWVLMDVMRYKDDRITRANKEQHHFMTGSKGKDAL